MDGCYGGVWGVKGKGRGAAGPVGAMQAHGGPGTLAVGVGGGDGGESGSAQEETYT